MLRILAVVSALGALAWGQAAAPRIQEAGELEWKVSGTLPPGAEYHLIYEDPATHAVETLVRFPSGYALPPHSHTHDETLLVLKGKLAVESGGETRTLGPGSYAVFPAGAVHGLRTAGWKRLEMLVSLNGPFDVKGLPPVK